MGALFGAEIGGGPARDGEFWVLGGIAAGNVVVVLVEDVAKLIHQHGAKWLIACVQGGLGEVDTEAQVVVIGSGE